MRTAQGLLLLALSALVGCDAGPPRAGLVAPVCPMDDSGAARECGANEIGAIRYDDGSTDGGGFEDPNDPRVTGCALDPLPLLFDAGADPCAMTVYLQGDETHELPRKDWASDGQHLWWVNPPPGTCQPIPWHSLVDTVLITVGCKVTGWTLGGW